MAASGTAASWGSDDVSDLSPPWPWFPLCWRHSQVFSSQGIPKQLSWTAAMVMSTVSQPNIANEERATLNPIVPELSPIGLVWPISELRPGGWNVLIGQSLVMCPPPEIRAGIKRQKEVGFCGGKILWITHTLALKLQEI